MPCSGVGGGWEGWGRRGVVGGGGGGGQEVYVWLSHLSKIRYVGVCPSAVKFPSSETWC